MKDEQQLVEAVARAMLAASRPSVNPDDLTPAPRGQLGMMSKWRLYEHLATAALSILKPEIEAMREAGAELAEEVRMNKAGLIQALTARELKNLMAALHKWNTAALNGGPTNAG